MLAAQGIGALYVRRRPRVRLNPIISGGGQERGLRSGTVPTMLAVGLGAACEVAGAEMAHDLAHVLRLEERLRKGITGQLQVRLRLRYRTIFLFGSSGL